MKRESKEAFFDSQAKTIALHGFSTLSVGDKISPFTYTIGLFKSFNHPEMIIFGLPAETAHGVLSDIALKAKSGAPFDLSKPTDKLFADCDVFFVEVPKAAYSDYVLSAIRFNGEENFPVFQVVWPSAMNKLYPWDLDADAKFVAMQPVLGHRTCREAEQDGGGQPATRFESK